MLVDLRALWRLQLAALLRFDELRHRRRLPDLRAAQHAGSPTRYINFGRTPGLSMIAGVASVDLADLLPQGRRADRRPAQFAGAQRLCEGDGRRRTCSASPSAGTVYRTIYYDTPELATDVPLPDRRSAQGADRQAERRRLPAQSGALHDGRRDRPVAPGEPAHEPGDRALLATEWPPGGRQSALRRQRLRAARRRPPRPLDLGNSIRETGLDSRQAGLGRADRPGGRSPPTPKRVVARLGEHRLRTLIDREAYEAELGHRHHPDRAPPTAQDGGQAPTSRSCRPATARVARSPRQPLRAHPDRPQSLSRRGQRGDRAAPGLRPRRAGRRGHAGHHVPMSADGARHRLDTRSSPAPAASPNSRSSARRGRDRGLRAGAGARSGAADRRASIRMLNTYMYMRTLPADADIAALSRPGTMSMPTCWRTGTRWRRAWTIGSISATRRRSGLTRRVIKQLTDPANFEAYRFMPVTRDMTRGRAHPALQFPRRAAGAGRRPKASPPHRASAAPPAKMRSTRRQPLDARRLDQDASARRCRVHRCGGAP